MPNAETVRAYLAQAIALFPFGPAWYAPVGSTTRALLEALATEAARIDERGDKLLKEMDPTQTFEMLSDFEKTAGLPDACAGDEVNTIESRRAALLVRLRALGGQSIEYFTDLAATYGFAITIEEFSPFEAGRSRAGDPANGQAWRFVWQVNAPEVAIRYFRAGIGAAGEPIASWGNNRLECLIDQYGPGHTLPIFAYYKNPTLDPIGGYLIVGGKISGQAEPGSEVKVHLELIE